MKNKTCIHRHGPESHPNCFSKKWWKSSSERIGYLDIEASGLDADTDWMLSWALKEYKSDKVESDFVTYDDIFERPGKVNPQFDKNIVATLLDTLKNFTGVVTYYGTGFDIKFIRTKAMQYDLEFPKYGELKHIDLYYQVASKMKLSHSSLETSTKTLGIEGKTKLGFRYWKLACLGDEQSMEKLLDHNKKDVLILERLHRKLEPFGKFDRKSV